jgi:hypothetical protein
MLNKPSSELGSLLKVALFVEQTRAPPELELFKSFKWLTCWNCSPSLTRGVDWNILSGVKVIKLFMAVSYEVS